MNKLECPFCKKMITDNWWKRHIKVNHGPLPERIAYGPLPERIAYGSLGWTRAST